MAPFPIIKLAALENAEPEAPRVRRMPVRVEVAPDIEESCPVIYADRVYLGSARSAGVRVVCFESVECRRPKPLRRNAG
jgi:hypothetical protein